MKLKTLLFSGLVLIIATTKSNAQIGKGSTLLGGSIGFGTQKNDFSNNSLTTFYVNPAVGKAIRQNLIIGADLNFFTNEINGEGSMIINDKRYGAGFFIRKYATLGKNFYLFGQGRIGGDYVTYKNNQNPGGYVNNSKGYNLTLGFYPGISYGVTKKLQLELGLPGLLDVTYSNSKANGIRRSTFSGSTALSNFNSLSVGIRFLLNKGAQ